MNIATIEGKTILPLCINLLRSPERKKSVDSQMKDVGFPINFCEGVDRKHMLDNHTEKEIELNEVVLAGGDRIFGVVKPTIIKYTRPSDGQVEVYRYIPPGMIRSRYNPYTTALYLGTIGCSISHMKCLKAFDDSGCDYALILEDDVDIVSRESQFLTNALSQFLKEEFDFFLLGTGFHRDYSASPDGYRNEEVYETAVQWYSGSSAYMISRSGLEKIKRSISDYETVFSAADEFFGLCQADLGCRILSCRNKVFRLHETLVESTMTDYA
jgi:GR25 family glycosyltransferase involved in LPS biosynthesis